VIFARRIVAFSEPAIKLISIREDGTCIPTEVVYWETVLGVPALNGSGTAREILRYQLPGVQPGISEAGWPVVRAHLFRLSQGNHPSGPECQLQQHVAPKFSRTFHQK
jgi:hypothetical protein